MMCSSQGIMLISSSLLLRTQRSRSNLANNSMQLAKDLERFTWSSFNFVKTCVQNISWWSYCSRSHQGLPARFHSHSRKPSQFQFSVFWELFFIDQCSPQWSSSPCSPGCLSRLPLVCSSWQEARTNQIHIKWWKPPWSWRREWIEFMSNDITYVRIINPMSNMGSPWSAEGGSWQKVGSSNQSFLAFCQNHLLALGNGFLYEIHSEIGSF